MSVFFLIYHYICICIPPTQPPPPLSLYNPSANILQIKERPVKESIVITPDKMVDFYTCNMVEGKDGEPLDWKSTPLPPLSVSYGHAILTVE